MAEHRRALARFSAHGVGFGRVRDIRFVEPTVKDRIAVLDLVQRLLASTQ